MHAERDNRIHVGNSRSKRIDNNQSESIGHNKTIEVGNNHHEVIGGNMTLMVGPNILQKGVTATMQVLRSKMRDVMTDNLGKFTDLLGFLSPEGMGEGNLVIGVGKNKAETVSSKIGLSPDLRRVLQTGLTPKIRPAHQPAP